MSDSAASTPLDLTAFVELLGELDAGGFEFAIIGGMAVGAYARTLGETCLSADLDLIATTQVLNDLLESAADFDLRIVERPRPRTLPVAVFRWRGLEVNVLTSSDGLSPADAVVRNARIFDWGERSIRLPIADPFDLLRNKLALARDKDTPHVELLTAFVEDEILSDFQHAGSARGRIAPLRRYLDVLACPNLPEALALRLIDVAPDLVARRFIAGHLGDASLAARLLDASPETEAEALRAILGRRGLG